MSTTKGKSKNADQAKAKKLALNKDTIMDLTVGDKADKVRGGAPRETYYVTCSCTAGAC